MKAKIEIDATPQEMRALLGLPDVEPLQQEVLEKVRARTVGAIESNDPAELMRLLIPVADQFKSMETLQSVFWNALGGDVMKKSASEQTEE